MSYFEKAVTAYKTALELMKEKRETGKDLCDLVTISEGNTKTGKIPSVSLLPRLTCPWNRCKNTCGARCYAIKLANLRPTVMNSYARNTAIMKLAPWAYFKAVDKTCSRSEHFRFHIAGDIPNRKYFRRMVRTARNNPDCSILCFTKQYEIVNRWIHENGSLPENLHILFSGWSNLKPENPYNLPETTVYAKDEDKKPEWLACGGNCLDCVLHCGGCWNANKGETVAFKIH